jgi:hypothetical protein
MLIYRRTVQRLLRHRRVESTGRYLGIEIDDAIEIAERIKIRCNWAVRGGSAQRSSINAVESGAMLRAHSVEKRISDEHYLARSTQPLSMSACV